MAFAVTINVGRRLPIINGFVMIPDGQRLFRTTLTPQDVIDLIPGTQLFRLGKDPVAKPSTTVQRAPSGFDKDNYQMWLILPEFERLDGPNQDFFQILRDAAETT